MVYLNECKKSKDWFNFIQIFIQNKSNKESWKKNIEKFRIIEWICNFRLILLCQKGEIILKKLKKNLICRLKNILKILKMVHLLIIWNTIY